MRRRYPVMLLLLSAVALAVPCRAEDSPDQVKRMYDDTLTQLQDTQQRKTQLAADNEALKARIAQLEQQLAAEQAKTAQLKKENATLVEKDFFLHSHYAAWQEFLHHYPRFEERWKTFLENDLSPMHTDAPLMLDPYWPTAPQA